MDKDSRYYLECYKDFLATGLSLVEYAQANNITLSYAEKVTSEGKKYCVDCYVDYLNNYLTVAGYADLNFMCYSLAEFIINVGRGLYNESLPKQVEKIQVGRKVFYAVFCGSKRKNTVLLSECEIFTAESDLHNHLKKISK